MDPLPSQFQGAIPAAASTANAAPATSTPLTDLFHQLVLVPIKNRYDAPKVLQEAAAGSVIYYLSSRLPDTVCLIINDTDARKITDINDYEVINLQKIGAGYAKLSAEELKKKVEEIVQEKLPQRIRPYDTEEEARKAVFERNEPYAFWIQKDAENVYGKTVDKFGGYMFLNPWLAQLERNTGTHHIGINSHYGKFSTYQKNQLEDRLALLASFKQTLMQSNFSSAEEAKAYVAQQEALVSKFPENLQPYFQRMAFYKTEENGVATVHMLFKPRGDRAEWQDVAIPPEDLKWIDEHYEMIIEDLGRFRKIERRNLTILEGFATRADQASLQRIYDRHSRQINTF